MSNDVNVNLGKKLIKYLRAKYNNPSIDFSEPLTRFGRGESTSIYKFRLVNEPPQLTGPLVLRLFPNQPGYTTGLANKEGTIQNILLKSNYPTPKAHIICEDVKFLGGDFIVMDFMKGKPMIESVPLSKIPDMLAETHVKLHTIDPKNFIESMMNSSVLKYWYDGTVFVDTWLTPKNISWLKPGLKWVNENEPSVRSSAIVHGDFHCLNLLVGEGEVSAVLDWSSARVGEPERDVASTRNILRTFGPAIISEMDWVPFIDDYLAAYIRRAQLNLDKERYYEAVHCLNILEALEAGFVHDLPGARDRSLKRFNELTGLNLLK